MHELLDRIGNQSRMLKFKYCYSSTLLIDIVVLQQMT